MKILVTNDDGIFADGLRILVSELSKIAQVIVVAPHQERSITGTAVTLRRPLRVQRIEPVVPEVATYSVEGTPSDSVILAIGKLAENGIDLVVSGINQGLNLGDDVLISGTVSAALQGYLHGLPAIAVSAPFTGGEPRDNAAKLATLLAKGIDGSALSTGIFLNINMPDLPLAELRGIKVTQRATQSHRFAVEEEPDGGQTYYRLRYHRVNNDANSNTDITAIEQGYISITPLNATLPDQSSPTITDSLFADLLHELQEYQFR